MKSGGRVAATLTALVLAAGCSSGVHQAQRPDIATAHRFAAFPLYWVGPRFEKWDVAAIQGVDVPRGFVTFIYGECSPSGGEQPSCTPPFEIQVRPLCSHLAVVASDPIWRTRVASEVRR